MSRSQLNYKSRRREDPNLLCSILEIKDKHPYYGQPRVSAVLRSKGFEVNGKRVYRLLKTMSLLVPQKIKRSRIKYVPQERLPQACRQGDVWSVDFVLSRLSNGDPFRCFTLIDTYTREVPEIFVSRSMHGYAVVDYLEQLKTRIKLPRHIILDNGPEFTNHVFVTWANRNNIILHFIDPGKPVQNAYVESFNGKFRSECLSLNTFPNIEVARRRINKWLHHYNNERPHSSLDYLTPKKFADLQPTVIDPKKNLPVLKTG
ncbi:MAG: hypothetical protein COT74_04435 [Bdellovibrionales bacterium CG10_big_fil_rev_8_21_14_0_10_45_34]|nr:MAG: hypothetical protein COT74_04435 [Bdellovibrionales bacterium CG10_big_fil_rev_8_21_14_0_10_45_34]